MRKLLLLILCLMPLLLFPQEIRVIISNGLDTNGMTLGYEFNEIKLSGTLVIKSSEIDQEGTDIQGEISIKPGDGVILVSYSLEGGLKITMYFYQNTIVVQSVNGTAQVLSTKRRSGTPSYPGNFIVRLSNKKLYLINAVDLEEYIARVIPSEVAMNFNDTTLAVQAIISRTRAIHDIRTGLKSQGYHCDDSIRFQVYNNEGFYPKALRIAKETEGMVLTNNGSLMNSLTFFSSSHGFTAGNDEIWAVYRNQIVYVNPHISLRGTKSFFGNLNYDPKDENFWLAFFKTIPNGVEFFDIESPFFRWSYTIDNFDLTKLLETRLKLLADSDSKNKTKYLETLSGTPIQKVDYLEEIRDIRVVKRSESGAVQSILLETDNGKYLAHTPERIQSLFRPRNFTLSYDMEDISVPEYYIDGSENGQSTSQPQESVKISYYIQDIYLNLKNGSKLKNYAILPSPFFSVEFSKDKQQVTIYGGGFGHGVGLSQYGANYLAKKGWKVEEILSFYYKNTKVEKIASSN